MKALPKTVKAYRRTPLFTHETVPAALLKNHQTKKGVWGLLRVTQGRIEYVINERERYILDPETPGVIEPETVHHIYPEGAVSFYVEFYS